MTNILNSRKISNYYSNPYKFYIQALTDSFSQKSEWQQVFSAPQNFFTYIQADFDNTVV